MKVRDYEYTEIENNYNITEERKEEIIRKLKSEISKKNTIALFKVLNIGESDEEYDFIYEWLDSNDTDVRGINGSITGEIENYEQIRRFGQSKREEPIPRESLEKEKELQKEYFIRIEKGKLPGATKEDKKDARKARDEFFGRNMRLADWVANWNQFREFNYTAEELQDFAYQGLLKAIERFDYHKTYIKANGDIDSYAFSTYATKTIVRTMFREIYKENPLPIYRFEEIKALNTIIDEFNRERPEVTPTNEEIAVVWGVPVWRVEDVKEAKYYYEKNVKDKVSIEELNERNSSFDEISSRLKDSDRAYVVGNGDSITGIDSKRAKTPYKDIGVIVDGVFVENDKVEYGVLDNNDSEEKCKHNGNSVEVRDKLLKILSGFNKKEAIVILARYGILTGKPYTLEEIGEMFNVTRGRIMQVEAKAIRKLRHPTRRKLLEGFVDENLVSLDPLLPPDTKKEDIVRKCLESDFLDFDSYAFKRSNNLRERINEESKDLTELQRFLLLARAGVLTGNVMPKGCIYDDFKDAFQFGNRKKITKSFVNNSNLDTLLAFDEILGLHYYSPILTSEDIENISYKKNTSSQMYGLYVKFLEKEIKEKEELVEQNGGSKIPDEIIPILAELKACNDVGDKKTAAKLYGELDDELQKEIDVDYFVEDISDIDYKKEIDEDMGERDE